MSNALLNAFPQEGSNDTLISTSENRITKAAALQEVVENLPYESVQLHLLQQNCKIYIS